MPTPTYTPLANITLASSVGTVTFSSIPQTYRDLVLVVDVRANSGNANVRYTLNADSASSYARVYMSGNGSTTLSGAAGSSFFSPDVNSVASTTNSLQQVMNLFDYSATDKHKTALFRSDAAASGTDVSAQRWPSTAAVTTITCVEGYFNNWAAGSTFALYGIAA